MAEERKMISVYFSAEEYQHLEALVKKTGASSTGDVIREALCVYSSRIEQEGPIARKGLQQDFVAEAARYAKDTLPEWIIKYGFWDPNDAVEAELREDEAKAKQ